MSDLSVVGKPILKVDSLSLACGTARYTADFEVKDPLHLVFFYSPHAHAEILSIDDNPARSMEGVVDVFHSGNTPSELYTTAGQGYPEPSPYDTALFNKKVRYVGDIVGAVLAESTAAARAAAGAVRVEYRQLEPLFDPEKSMDPGAPCLHDDGAFAPLPVPYRPEENVAGEVLFSFGDVEKGFAEADFIEEETYRTHYTNHCAMEPHAATATFDEKGRLVIYSSTQVPFHARRTVSRVTGIPAHKIRVVKPRIGGGFGSKQEIILEPYVALAAWKYKRSVKAELTRREVFTTARTRHPMRVRIKTGVKRDGTITALEMNNIMNTGAYGAHALTVLSNAGSKVLPMFNKIPNVSFTGRAVYTTLPVGGAYRGYGATQGYFAFNQHVDGISRKIGMDFVDYIKKWHIREGETSEVFKAIGEGTEGVSQIIKSCKLSECLDRGAEEIGWSRLRGKRITSGSWVKGVGAAVSMQGSGIPKVDMGSASMKMNDDGSFNLYVGATDIGTGSDTILSQIAAETLKVPVEMILILSSDTDLTPFDTGAYASSTTYVSGQAVLRCAGKIRDQILSAAAVLMGAPAESLFLGDGGIVVNRQTGEEASFSKIACFALYSHDQFQIQAGASFTGDESPAPFMAHFAEVDVDLETGKVRLVKFVSAGDCGRPINPVLTEGQIEGATMNGISYALTEQYLFDPRGKMTNNSFWDYKIFGTLDMPEMKTILAESNEPTGPYGAKSISEIGINGPAPAIANAIFDATGRRIFDLPLTPEKVLAAIKGVK
ncbi:molybdopterin cofactor-binding domain-containing protein [Aminivibrio sp.]|jgi:CO/xanthine dehydrogenase Mo-binding subunit|uniref:xanthine dehydrogenase family protein molybdopterin-binding subunit n=1 Tax=Aminivibrio sp. TaxID=1872489 RepID=UPI001A575157|nr:molybdopterin cofactor-binding domain-containing protein [Aminivibrio sp.]MBL3539211.1 molybdopterin-dependent oxidoreductase [Aminivibrio sp.]MDK2958602.1 putative selenate reductase molybdopterin-binding subunit [Synergistaceae bacterium]